MYIHKSKLFEILMKLKIPYLFSFYCLCLGLTPFATLSADTFHLNDGSTVKGTIISEDKRSYLVRAEISNNVFDQKTLMKLDITRRIKEDPSLKAFEEIADTLPIPDLTPASTYANIIDTKLKPFIKKYPKSVHIDNAKNMLKTLESEQATITAGGVKIDGNLLSAEEVVADKYEVSAIMDLKRFLKLAKNKRYRLALNKLNHMEELYPNSTQVRAAQRIALNFLPFYKKDLEVLLSEVDKIKKRRQYTLDAMSSSDRNRTKAIFKSQEEQYLNLLATIEAKKGSVKWLPINPFYKEQITANLQLIPKEIARISNEYKRPTMMAAAIYRSTLQALDEGNLPKALELHTKFKAEKPSEMFAEALEMKVSEQSKILEEIIKKKNEEAKLAEMKRLEEERLAKQKAEEAKQASQGTAPKEKKGNILQQMNKNRKLEESLKQ